MLVHEVALSAHLSPVDEAIGIGPQSEPERRIHSQVLEERHDLGLEPIDVVRPDYVCTNEAFGRQTWIPHKERYLQGDARVLSLSPGIGLIVARVARAADEDRV